MVQFAVEQLFFMYWQAYQRVSSEVVPIRETPHYRFARKCLTEGTFPPAQAPAGSGYGTYARWEAVCMGRVLLDVKTGSMTGDPMHNERQFLQNIVSWGSAGQNFQNDGLANLVDVTEFTMNGSNGYAITDGAHRAAYFAAVVDTHVNAPWQPPTIHCQVSGSAAQGQFTGLRHNSRVPTELFKQDKFKSYIVAGTRR